MVLSSKFIDAISRTYTCESRVSCGSALESAVTSETYTRVIV